jgi:two-component system phosphate regulon sensor histidine kinase PhoR
MRKAVYLRFAAVILVTALISGSVSAMLYAANEEKKAGEDLSKLCFAISRLYKVNSDAKYLSDSAGGARVTIISPDGSVSDDSSSVASLMENHSDREEVIAANAVAPTIASRYSKTLGQPYIYAAIRLEDGNILRLARSYSGLWGGIARQLPIFAAATIAALFLAAFIAGNFTRKIINPLEKAADDIASGNFDSLEARDNYYEIDKIAGRIRALLENINHSRQETVVEKDKIGFILSNMAEGFILLDHDMVIRLVNNSAKKIFRCDIDVVGQSISFLTRNLKIESSVAKSVSENYSSIFDLSFEDDIYSARVSPVSGELFDGQGRGATVLLVDVTAERKSQDMRSEFFSNASHELKTPITSIMGFSQMLENGLLDQRKAQEIYSRIGAESKRMSNLINDILTISRLESGAGNMETEVVDLEEVALDVAKALAPQALELNVSVSVDCKGAIIKANRRYMHDMLSNLIENAVKYNVVNGKVRVSAHMKPHGIVVSVSDTGIGIAPGVQSRIFERFYRASKTVGGTGLGLAIVKHIVMSMGGEIEIESKIGTGTNITVLLPGSLAAKKGLD